MSLRREFVLLATQSGANVRELCRRFQISAKTAYKWIDRFRRDGVAALADQSRRPHRSPGRSAREVERAIVKLRHQHPDWGARKLIRRLQDLGHQGLPSPSTGQAILKRAGCISAQASAQHSAFLRFEHERPNALWQMDFKGHFALSNTERCHPLTVLDDHSRFNLALRACGNEQGVLVQEQLSALFRCFGLPEAIGVDNGPPWGDSASNRHTALTVWLMRYGVRISHSRPYHPQTLGKDERFHRTLKAEVLARAQFSDLSHAQRGFDAWREVYNFERPHEALDGDTPASRYRPSPRSFPATPPPIEYAPDCHVRKVDESGKISFQGKVVRIGKAFYGYPIGLRSTSIDGVCEVYFCNQQITSIDLRRLNSLT